MCANSATPKYFSFLEHFYGNILHSTSLMRNTFLSSYQIRTQISTFPSYVSYLITGIPINSYLKILYIGYFTISACVWLRACVAAQPARFLRDGSRLSIAPKHCNFSTAEDRKYNTQSWSLARGHNGTGRSAVLCHLLKNFWWLRTTLSWSAQFEIFFVAGTLTSEINFPKTSV